MNKIYKVVWSKVKHCYVVTSELAKRQTKGCGARSLRMATVSLGVAASLLCAGAVLPIFCPSVAEAAIASAGSTNVQTDYRGMYTFQADSKTFTVDESATSATNNYAYGNVAMGKPYLESSIYEMHDEKLVRVDTIAFGAPYTTMVLTANPLYNTEQVKQLGVKTTISAIVKASETVAKDVSGYKVTITGGTLDEVMGGLSYSGNVSNNAVEMSNGTASNVYGGYSDTGNANENTVTISGGSVSNVYCGKGSSSTNAGEASRNQVFISNNANVSNQVIGGTADTITYKNSVTISGGKVYSVVGAQNYGFGENALASFNEVAIKGSAQVTESVYGARDGYGSPIMSDNTVTIDGSAVVSGNVFGASGFEKDKTNNKVYINNGSVTSDVYGANLYASWDEATGSVKSNEVYVSGGKITGKIYGGSLQGSVTGEIKSNKVDITGGEVTSNVHGGFSSSTSTNNVDQNSVSISKDATVSGNVYGGKIGSNKTGNITNNSVTMSGGIVGGFLYGGHSEQTSGAGSVSGNTVEITGGTISGIGHSAGGSVYYYSDDSNKFYVKDNTVKVSNDVDIRCSIIGGRAQGDAIVQNNRVEFSANNVDHGISIIGGSASWGGASDNKVIFSKGTVKEIIGAETNGSTATLKGDVSGSTVEVFGGTVYERIIGGNGFGKADNNTVTIKGGTMTSRIVIGGNVNNNGDADENTITISGGTIGKEGGSTSIWGGYASSGGASNNTVTISGDAQLLGNVSIYGAEAHGTSDIANANNNTVNILSKIKASQLAGGNAAGTSSGNTLNIAATDVTAGSVYAFQTIALTDAVPWDNGKTVLSAKDFDDDDSIKATLDITAATNLASATSGQMTLLASQTDNDLNALSLKYDGGSATLDATTTSVKIKDEVSSDDDGSGVVITAQSSHTVSLDADNNFKNVFYKAESGSVTGVTFNPEKQITFSTTEAARDLTGKTFADVNTVDAEKLKFAETSDALKVADTMTLVANATGITTKVDNNTITTIEIKDYEDAQKIKYSATASGTVTSDGTTVSYKVDTVTLKSVDLGRWNGTTSDLTKGDTKTWIAADGSVKVNSADAITVVPTTTQAILTAGSGMFERVDVVKEVAFAPVTKDGVTLTGTRKDTIKTTQTNVANDTITYELGKKDVKNIDIGEVTWNAAALDGSSKEYDYGNVKEIGAGNFAMTFDAPEKVAKGESMTLLLANTTLNDLAEVEKTTAYNGRPLADGLDVKIDGNITGKLAKNDSAITYAATANQATKLTFGNVEWKDSGALMTRPANITFDGAEVDTSGINFTNVEAMDANKEMTLVAKFDGTPSNNGVSSTYQVGAGLQGEGMAVVDDSKTNLLYKTLTQAEALTPTEETHKAVMAMEAGMALLASGGEYVGKMMDQVGDVANKGVDGISTGAAFGGSGMSYSTGSRVSTHAWNAAVAVGSKKESEKGSFTWGIFGEYGKGSYTLHSDAGRGEGDAHYAGGGLLAKWLNSKDVYVEASFRLGRLSDNASNLMHDKAGNGYGYDVHANYFGAHVGVGKVFNYKGGKSLDVYGKFFYTKRDSVDFTVKDQPYHLDSVGSSLLRIGARYGSNDKKWNWYGGLAYEYEFDGEAKGTVAGKEIRAASIRGSSVRAELGMRMDATKDNPWQTDISIYGYGGKHRGFGGNVSVAYTF